MLGDGDIDFIDVVTTGHRRILWLLKSSFFTETIGEELIEMRCVKCIAGKLQIG